MSRFKEINGERIYSKISKICGANKDNICTSFIRLLPKSIQERYETEPIGWFVGFLGILNMIGILFIAVLEYYKDVELSSRNKEMVEIIQWLFISNVITVFVIGILSYLLFTDDVSFTMFGVTHEWLKNLKSTEALLFAMTYLFGSSVYMLHESRILYKLRVNNLHAK
jgi:fructose-specific phosphotransferase system IIC component